MQDTQFLGHPDVQGTVLGCTGPAPSLPRTALHGVGQAVSHCTDETLSLRAAQGLAQVAGEGGGGICTDSWASVGGEDSKRPWGAQGRSTLAEVPFLGEPRVAPRVEQRPLGAHCAYNWGTLPSGQGGVGSPILPSGPNFPSKRGPRYLLSCVCPSPSPTCRSPSAGADSPVPPAQVPPGRPLHPPPSPQPLWSAPAPPHPQNLPVWEAPLPRL